MATATVDTEIIVRTERMMAAFKKLPDQGGAEARKMINQIGKEWAKAEKAAKDASGKAGKEWDKGIDAITKKLASKFGGVTADLADLSGSASGVLGAIGVAGAGAVAGITALAVGSHKLAEEAAASVRDLQAMGLAAIIPDEAINNVEHLAEGQHHLDIQTARLTANVGGPAADAWGEMDDAIAGVENVLVDLDIGGRIADFAAWAEAINPLTLTLRALGISLYDLADAGSENTKVLEVEASGYALLGMSADDAAVDQQVVNNKLRDSKIAQDKLADATKKAADLQHQATQRWIAEQQAINDATLDRVSKAVAAEHELIAIGKEANDDKLTGEQRVQRAYDERIKKIQAALELTHDMATAEQDEGDAEARRVRDLTKLHDDEAAHLMDLQKQVAGQQKELLAKLHDLQLDNVDAAIDGVSQILDSAQGALATLMDQQSEQGQKQKAAILAEFRGSQALAIAEIAMNTAVAIAKDGTKGPLAPLLIAKDLVLGATGAASVLSQKPPEFPGGGLVGAGGLSADHVGIGASPGEGVVNRGGMGVLGEDGLRRLNRREDPFGGLVIPMVYKHRVFDRIIVDNLRRGGPLARALASRRKPGHASRA